MQEMPVNAEYFLTDGRFVLYNWELTDSIIGRMGGGGSPALRIAGREVHFNASDVSAQEKAAQEGSRFSSAYEDQERQERTCPQKAQGQEKAVCVKNLYRSLAASGRRLRYDALAVCFFIGYPSFKKAAE